MFNIAKHLHLTILPVFTLLIFASSAFAIPAFTREHKAECTTCHTIFPELNEYGEAFYKSGFAFSKAKHNAPAVQEEISAAAAPSTGDGDAELLAAMKEGSIEESNSISSPEKSSGAKKGENEALWIAGLPSTLPLSLSGTFNYSFDNSPGTAQNQADFTTRALSLLSAGVFREDIAFYVKYNLYVQGQDQLSQSTVPINENPPRANDIDEMYLIFRNVKNTPVNLKVGRFRPKQSLWKKSNKIMATDMAPTSYKVGLNVFSLDAPQDAIEVNGIFKNRIFTALGMVDRNNQNNKEFYGHLSFRFGGTDFNGKEPEIDFDNESLWDYLGVTVALYGYNGKNMQSSTVWNDYYRAGGDMDISYKNSRFRLSGIYGNDDAPYYDSWANGPYGSYAVAAEFEQIFAVNFIGAVRVEKWDHGNDIQNRFVPVIAYTPIENTKISLEYQRQSGSVADNKVIASLRFAF